MWSTPISINTRDIKFVFYILIIFRFKFFNTFWYSFFNKFNIMTFVCCFPKNFLPTFIFTIFCEKTMLSFPCLLSISTVASAKELDDKKVTEKIAKIEIVIFFNKFFIIKLNFLCLFGLIKIILFINTLIN